MRFTEFISPEDQLALWRSISDKVWSTFAELPKQKAELMHQQTTTQVGAKPTPKPATKGVPHVSAKAIGKRKATPAKAPKSKGVPMAPPPKPLPKPQPQQIQPTPIQTKHAQTLQHQQLAAHIQQAMAKKQASQAYPQPVQSISPKAPVATAVAPMTNSYSERDKDELVLHRRQNPLKPLRDQKPL